MEVSISKDPEKKEGTKSQHMLILLKGKKKIVFEPALCNKGE